MTNQKIVVSVVFIIILAIMAFAIYKTRNNMYNNQNPNQALITNFEECTSAGNTVMESYPRQCRTASGEIFVENVVAPNPNPQPVSGTTTGYVSGHVTIGPNCPGPEIQGQPCPPPPEAYTSREIIIYNSNGTIKETAKIDTQGNYKVVLAAGSYFIEIHQTGTRTGEKKPFTVTAGKTTVVDFDIDTGIR